MTQQEAQAINRSIATQWYQGIGLEHDGIEIGRILEYEVMRVVGNVLRAATQKEEPNNVDGHGE